MNLDEIKYEYESLLNHYILMILFNNDLMSLTSNQSNE